MNIYNIYKGQVPRCNLDPKPEPARQIFNAVEAKGKQEEFRFFCAIIDVDIKVKVHTLKCLETLSKKSGVKYY